MSPHWVQFQPQSFLCMLLGLPPNFHPCSTHQLVHCKKQHSD
uniref:Uncharacterized protein n=1 Tax=Arundo donax TaxID=35708 RepID=A0A0A9G5M5_ARUDO